MLGISFYELLVIVLVAVILIKPKNLNSVLYFLGKSIAKVKKISSKMFDSVEDLASIGNPDDFTIIDKSKAKSSHKKPKKPKV